MPSTSQQRTETGRRAEDAVAAELRELGFTVTNLNELVGNCPFADLVARRDEIRALVQVKGTVTAEGKFGVPAERARALQTIAVELACTAVYALAHLCQEQEVIRYAGAEQVATLAEADELGYAGTNRYHVRIADFPVIAAELPALLRTLSA